MTGALVGNLNSKRDRLRRHNGCYTKHPACDCCGKPCTEHYTDDRVCAGSDGPGFYICGRAACKRKAERIEAAGGIEALRTAYTTQRASNSKPESR
jgi:hypothetical protein